MILFFKHLIALDFKPACPGIKGSNCGEMKIVYNLLCWDILLRQKGV